MNVLFYVVFFVWFVSCTPFGDRDPTFKPFTIPKPPIQNVPTHKQCKNFSECANACSSVYLVPSEVEQCRQLSVDDVENLYKVGIYLQRPVARTLDRIRSDDFELFLSVGAESLIQYVDRYTISEARKVLSWLAEHRSIAQTVFSVGSIGYRKMVLGLLRSVDPLVAEEGLHRSLTNGHTFYKIANIKHNDYAIYMAHEVILEDLCEADYEYYYFNLLEQQEACVLRVYCHQHGNQYVHESDFQFISQVVEYDDIFDYIQEPDSDIGLNMDYNTIAPAVCDRICDMIPGSCS